MAFYRIKMTVEWESPRGVPANSPGFVSDSFTTYRGVRAVSLRHAQDKATRIAEALPGAADRIDAGFRVEIRTEHDPDDPMLDPGPLDEEIRSPLQTG